MYGSQTMMKITHPQLSDANCILYFWLLYIQSLLIMDISILSGLNMEK